MPLSPSLSPSLKADAYENGVAKTPLKAPAGANYSGAVKVSPTWSNYSEGDPILVRPIETGHESYIFSVSFSPDGTTLATGSRDKTVKLLDATAKYGPDGLLLAHPTFDIWSYGVVLYYAIAHKPLLETTGADQLRGKAERIKLARWSTADLTYAINDLDHGGFLRTRVHVFVETGV